VNTGINKKMRVTNTGKVVMGLDQYAYVASRAGQQSEFYEGSQFDKETGDYINPKVAKPREIAYWRKHPNLQGWMEKLWLRKQNIPTASEDQFIENKRPPGDFNGVELELTWEDLDELERAVTHNRLPETTGFFFGEDSNDYYRQQDLQFIKEARAELFLGLKVFYNSSW
jgi:hypothetical protein